MTETSSKISNMKPRYDLLDGLRGVAALMVILYHVGEGFATSSRDQVINHGYLAVDFFFVLSGFVIGYAYDGRWNQGMSTGSFILRRIRLQPMVLIAVVLGVISFILQGCEQWDGTTVSTSAVILSIIFGFFFIPSLPGTLPEVRGNGEMFPLNGPSWSLFFEYVGSLLYAFFLHRMSNRALTIFTCVAALALASIGIGNGSGDYHLGVGWTAANGGFFMGLARMTFSFSIGLLMSRRFKPIKVKGAFIMCSFIICCVLAVPFIGGENWPVLNGVYDVVCTLFVFPMVVYLGASGTTTDPYSRHTCEFLGAISYPVYIIHYPFMYMMYSWVWKNELSFSSAWPVAALIIASVILLAWGLLRYYDVPMRQYLTHKFKRYLN